MVILNGWLQHNVLLKGHFPGGSLHVLLELYTAIKAFLSHLIISQYIEITLLILVFTLTQPQAFTTSLQQGTNNILEHW